MRIVRTAIAAGVALPLVAMTAPGASAQLASGSGGVRHLHRVSVRLPSGNSCNKAVINGMTENGTVIGTTFCGRSAAFVRKPTGKTTIYRLPHKYARFTLAANISSNGIMAVDGQVTKAGKTTGYLVRPSGNITVLAAPAAGNHSTIVNGVNRHGAAVGFYCINTKCSKQAPFIYRHGTYQGFAFHNPKQVLPDLSEITDSGALIGNFYQAPNGNLRGFIRAHGKTKVIDAPGASKKLAKGTFLLGGANRGTVCGVSTGPHNYAVGYVRRHGNDHVINLKPNVRHAFTEITACNDHGEVALHVRLKSGPASFLGKIG